MRKFLSMLFVDNENGKISLTAIGIIVGLGIVVDSYLRLRITNFLDSTNTDKLAIYLDFVQSIAAITIAGTVGRYGFGRISRMSFGKSQNTIVDTVEEPVKKEESVKIPEGEVGNYFSVEDFDSKEGVPMPVEVEANVIELIKNLNVIRETINAPIIVTSGYRSPNHPIERKKKRPGTHSLGIAADIKADGYTNKQLFNVIKKLMDSGKIAQGGLSASYPNHCHYDIRGRYATW